MQIDCGEQGRNKSGATIDFVCWFARYMVLRCGLLPNLW